MPEHVVYITSWYPRAEKSEGTFIEMQLRVAKEIGVRAAVLQSEEVTGGNYVRDRLRGAQLFSYRRNPDVHVIENLAVHRTPLRLAADPELKRRKTLIRAAVRSIKRYAARAGMPDAFFHHGIFDYCYLTKALSEHFGIPYFFTEHSAFTAREVRSRNAFETEAFLRDFVCGAQRRFTVTRAYAEKFSRIFGLPFEYAPNVLTADFFAKQIPVRPAAPFRFINVGILEPHKNQALLIEAFAEAFGGDEDVTLTIAGDGRLGPDLAKLASERGVADRVELPGFLDRTALKAALDASHAFVLSSAAETFGVVLIEAMARGLPVIAPDIDGPRELVGESTGLCFEAGSRASLAGALRDMYYGANDYNPEVAVRFAKQNFGAEALRKYIFHD